ncbi:MAG TPA: hypothetical protein VNA69_19765 [Thermoanaerobaculia bacterium]|nr:hypothetical protein [Thermoanaerobaculia bacterium]
MPKFLFYAGTAFCFFLAVTSGAEAARAFLQVPPALSILLALAAGLAVATLFMRMAALLAARNLFAALMAVLCVACATTSLAGLLLLRWRAGAAPELADMHFVALMSHGFFVSLSLLSLRPYFSIQASRFLAALVFFPLPLFLLVLAQEMLATTAPLPASTPASRVFFSVAGLLFFSIAVHCVRHRHLFLEMTNLRELLDSRIDPTRQRAIGGVAFDL